MAHFKKPLAAALGAAFLASSVVPLASAAVNPFSAQQLSGGYDLPNFDKHQEGTCGDKKGAEGSCGEKGAEGSCGEKTKEGSCGEKAKEGSCGEGGEKAKEGSCGEGAEKAKEGKCGEGKCGGS